MKKLIGVLFVTTIIFCFGVTNVLADDTYYTVKEGDSLWQIADHNGLNVEELLEINNLQSEKIKPGDKFKIVKDDAGIIEEQEQIDRQARVYCVQEGDNLVTIADKFSTSVEKLKYVNNMSEDKIYVGDTLRIPFETNNVSRGGTMISGERILKKAEEYLGTPYKYGGQSPGGFDCSGFVKYVFGQQGYDLPRTASAQYQNGVVIDKASMVAGDLVFFACGGSSIDHVGIYSGDNKFIHSSSPRSGGVIYSSLAEEYYSRYFVGARRVLR